MTVLTEVTGNTSTAVEEAARLLGIKGKVYPVTLTRSTLIARLQDGTELKGESAIDLRRDKLDVGIDYVELEPKAYVFPPVLDAIKTADAIILGPGDIYTSVLPNLLVEDVAEAINESRALKIHVCNLMTKPAESAGFKASTFVNLLREYLGTAQPLDCLIHNSTPFPERLLQRYAAEDQHPVELDQEECSGIVNRIIRVPVLAAGVKLRHDPQALALAIMDALDPYPAMSAQRQPGKGRVGVFPD